MGLPASQRVMARSYSRAAIIAMLTRMYVFADPVQRVQQQIHAATEREAMLRATLQALATA